MSLIRVVFFNESVRNSYGGYVLAQGGRPEWTYAIVLSWHRVNSMSGRLGESFNSSSTVNSSSIRDSSIALYLTFATATFLFADMIARSLSCSACSSAAAASAAAFILMTLDDEDGWLRRELRDLTDNIG